MLAAIIAWFTSGALWDIVKIVVDVVMGLLNILFEVLGWVFEHLPLVISIICMLCVFAWLAESFPATFGG